MNSSSLEESCSIMLLFILVPELDCGSFFFETGNHLFPTDFSLIFLERFYRHKPDLGLAVLGMVGGVRVTGPASTLDVYYGSVWRVSPEWSRRPVLAVGGGGLFGARTIIMMARGRRGRGRAGDHL